MKKITVHLGKRSYPIIIGRGLLHKLGRSLQSLQLGSKVFIVSNKKVAKRFLPAVSRSLVQSGFKVFPYLLPHGGEQDKSEKELSKLWKAMAEIPLDRSSTVLALGGGVVGDISGFIASTYMRGLTLIQVPTTLLAQVDSAIGGKTAIDLPSAKNIVGTFYQPRMVICDVETLRTLGVREFQNSFAEVVKCGIIRDLALFQLLEKRADRFFSSLEKGKLGPPEFAFLETIVWRSALVKAKVVEQDERETKGLRMILNYGHTFGHALEGASRFRIPHGEAITTGMILAGELAKRMGIFSKQAQERQTRLIRRIGHPAKYRFSSARLLSFMRRDKKARNEKLRFVLPQAIGRVEVMDQVSERVVRKVLDEFRGK